MDYRKKKKVREVKIGDEIDGNDRISKLSDDLIHEIMWFLDARLAVQMSTLSKRWLCVWKTLPYLNFHSYNKHYIEDLNKYINGKFINYVFTERNNQCQLPKLDLCAGLPLICMRRYVRYAISHSVETMCVDLDRYCVLSMFNSGTLKELRLTMPFQHCDVMESDSWSLPNLTTLYLKRGTPINKFRVKRRPGFGHVGKFPQSCLSCLSSLTTLSLDECTLPENFNLPCLTTLYLVHCTLPKNVWDLPALMTLELENVYFYNDMREYFLALANLRNLSISMDIPMGCIGDCVITSYELVNLKIRISQITVNGSQGKILVSAPKLCTFVAIGFFPITFEGCELENVEIEFLRTGLYCVDNKKYLESNKDLFTLMFPQLGSVKNLTLDLKTLKELSKMSDLRHLKCPFNNLKHLKLPIGYKASSISSSVRRYLLGASPEATIVERLTTSSQVNVIPQIAPAISSNAQNVVLEQPLATPNKKKIKSQKACKKTQT